MKTIVFFNHKGGVSKTTSVFHFGWMLASLGYKVLLVDADPQCNLTGVIVSQGDFDKFESFYKKYPNRNIKAGLAPVFEGQLAPLKAVKPFPVSGRAGLFLLPGHLQLSEYEITLTLAQELSSSLLPLKNVPGAASALFRLTGESVKADFTLVDLNPSLSAINQNILLSADNFVIPNSPDYFCQMAINSLARVIPRWSAWHDQATTHPILKTATYPLPARKSALAGTLVQNFRLRKGAPTTGFQTQIDELNGAVTSILVPELRNCGMMMDEKRYADSKGNVSYSLGLVSDFNTMKATAHAESVPVFAIPKTQLGQGKVLAQNEATQKRFYEAYKAMATKLVSRTK